MNGFKQMALDSLLLDEAIRNPDFLIILRFYSWDGNWLSIGKNQKNIPKRWIELHNEKKLKIVRRPSGGDAVLHSGGITYSLAWSNPPKKKKTAYRHSCQWLLKSFDDMGYPLRFGDEIATPSVNGNCFSKSTSADLIDKDGYKRIGNAQLWRKGNLLQHGEIIFDPPRDLWEELFQTRPPSKLNLGFNKTCLEKKLTEKLFASWPEVSWCKSNLEEYKFSKFQKKHID